MKKTLFVLLATVFSVSLLHAQQPVVVTNKGAGWHKIGDAKVDFKSDKDKFIIMGADRFKSVKIKVMDAPVRIEDMEIQYEGGRKESVSFRTALKPGHESRVIPLKNHSSELRNVSFVYHTIPNSGADKATIELWGKK
jgi:hypothetical protein